VQPACRWGNCLSDKRFKDPSHLQSLFSFCISHYHSLATPPLPPPPPHSFHTRSLLYSIKQAKSFTQTPLTYLHTLVPGPLLHQSTQCNSSTAPSALYCSSPARMLCQPLLRRTTSTKAITSPESSQRSRSLLPEKQPPPPAQSSPASSTPSTPSPLNTPHKKLPPPLLTMQNGPPRLVSKHPRPASSLPKQHQTLPRQAVKQQLPAVKPQEQAPPAPPGKASKPAGQV